MKPSNAIRDELDRIATRHRGVLKPEDVVEAAQDPKSPLHDRFCWDDTKAAYEYRLWQARTLIRITVTVVDDSNKTPDRVWVSLKADRAQEKGGYRKLVTVLSDARLREELLEEALAEMVYFQEKYQRLHELADVFRVMKKTRTKVRA